MWSKSSSESLFTARYKGFLKDVEVRLTDETQGSNSTKREFYWITTLKTYYPDGLNIESDY